MRVRVASARVTYGGSEEREGGGMLSPLDEMLYRRPPLSRRPRASEALLPPLLSPTAMLPNGSPLP